MPDDPRLTQQFDQAEAAIREFEAAGPLGRLARRLTRGAPNRGDRELARLHTLGPEGRIAEGILGIVRSSQQVFDAVAAHGLAEDISYREYSHLQDYLLGDTPDSSRMAAPFVSVKFDEPERVAAVSGALPGLLHDERIDAYRYATLPHSAETTGTRTGGRQMRQFEEPFVVGLQALDETTDRIVGILPAGAVFLHYERELGSISAEAVTRLDAVVMADRATIRHLVTETLSAIEAIPPDGLE